MSKFVESIRKVNNTTIFNKGQGLSFLFVFDKFQQESDPLLSFLRAFFSGILSDVLILFAIIYLGEWLADVYGFSRVERAWWITLATLLMLTFILWARLGRILLWN